MANASSSAVLPTLLRPPSKVILASSGKSRCLKHLKFSMRTWVIIFFLQISGFLFNSVEQLYQPASYARSRVLSNFLMHSPNYPHQFIRRVTLVYLDTEHRFLHFPSFFWCVQRTFR